MKKTLSSRFNSWFYNWRREHFPTDFRYSIYILLATIVLFAIWWVGFPKLGNDYRIEFVGMIFDIIFILILFSLFQFRDRRRQNIEHQQEIIQDFKRWDSEEAHFRLAGAFRRLHGLGVTSLNLAGIQLTNFEFSKHEISDISNSTFYDGTWGNPLAEGGVQLTKVSFDYINCHSVQFSPFNPLSGFFKSSPSFAKITDCSFIHTDLSNAIFDGADIFWSKPPVDDLYQYEGDDDYGIPIMLQYKYGPFDNAELKNTSFKKAKFKNADFRNAIDVDMANFQGAIGLEDCIFDDEATKKAVLNSANAKAN